MLRSGKNKSRFSKAFKNQQKEEQMDKLSAARTGLFAFSALGAERVKEIGSLAWKNRGDIGLAIIGIMLADVSAAADAAEELSGFVAVELVDDGIIDGTFGTGGWQ
jgi:hypothetical protein